MAAKAGMRESETIELKKSLAELKEGLISMAAILNKHGTGELWFGVKNDGAAAGLFFAKTPQLQLRCAVFGGTSSATIIAA